MNATYDAENHLTAEAIVGGPGSSYQWGPNGHPIEIGSQTTGAFSYDTLHYDGDQLLFTTNAQGQADDIKVGTLGDITPLDSHFTGLTLWDRDISGEVVACHSATGAAGNGVNAPWRARYTEPTAYTSPCSMQGANAPGWSIPWTEFPTSPIWTQLPGNELSSNVSLVGHGGLLGMPRTDGITDGFTTIQGVRSYDGFASAWMEPDAYSGSIDDPASQQSHGYNGGNPLMYQDRSGLAANNGCPDTEYYDGTKCVPIPQLPPNGNCGQANGCVTACNWYCQLNKIPFPSMVAFELCGPSCALVVLAYKNPHIILQINVAYNGPYGTVTVSGCGVVSGSAGSLVQGTGGRIGASVSAAIGAVFGNTGYGGSTLDFTAEIPDTPLAINTSIGTPGSNHLLLSIGPGAGYSVGGSTGSVAITKGVCKK